jgi:hypothetical protein
MGYFRHWFSPEVCHFHHDERLQSCSTSTSGEAKIAIEEGKPFAVVTEGVEMGWNLLE